MRCCQLAGVEALAARGAVTGKLVAVIARHAATDFSFLIDFDDRGVAHTGFADPGIRNFGVLRGGRNREQERHQQC